MFILELAFMPFSPTWTDIVARLCLTVIAAGLIGFDREIGGHNAGLRTTILVGLAAAVAMIQANLLLPVDGKTSASFAVLDLMRLPLGILTGVGFIGGGAILRRGDLVSGVTTAGTLWIMTVIVGMTKFVLYAAWKYPDTVSPVLTEKLVWFTAPLVI